MKRHRPNLALFLAIISLIALGTVLISSASVVYSQQLTGDPNFHFREHLMALIGGIVLMGIGYKLDYSIWRKIAPFAIAGGLLLLIAVFIPGIGMSHGGARRWIQWPFFFSPTEVYKFSLIIYLAAWFEKRQSQVKSFWYSTFPFMAILGLTALLIMMQPDTGTLMSTAAIAATMFFVAGASMLHVSLIALTGAGALALLISTASYRMDRFMIFLNPTADAGGAGYQINQALMAIGTGGLIGLGFGQSRQKFNYLPEASTDSIFAITAEELGFIRAGLIIFLFMVLAVQGYRVAQKAPDQFSRLLATGVTSWIVIQALINMFAMMSLIPLTGVPLPFLSKGSSSTLVLMLASGILLNISKHTEGETRESSMRRRGNWWSYLTGSGRH